MLLTEESHTADLKAIEVAPAKLTRSMAAFCNAEGGELYVGVDEDRTRGVRSWRGFGSIEAANGHLQAFEAQFPFGQFVDWTPQMDWSNRHLYVNGQSDLALARSR